MDHEIRPKLVTINGTLHQVPVKRTKLYSLIDTGELVRVKIGARTFILQDSIDQFVARLAADASAAEASTDASA